jgi:hypothetical protein
MIVSYICSSRSDTCEVIFEGAILDACNPYNRSDPTLTFLRSCEKLGGAEGPKDEGKAGRQRGALVLWGEGGHRRIQPLSTIVLITVLV